MSNWTTKPPGVAALGGLLRCLSVFCIFLAYIQPFVKLKMESKREQTVACSLHSRFFKRLLYIHHKKLLTKAVIFYIIYT